MDKAMLFSPVELKNITLPGRIVRAATEYFCAQPDGHVIPCEIEVYEKLGREPLGLILTGNTCVSPEGRSNVWQNALWSDEFLQDTRRIADAAQICGVPAVMQLGHGGERGNGNNGGLRVLTPDTMSKEDIRMVVRSFADAAFRAKQAGMRGVMLHCAHGFLLSEFFYPSWNHRTDEYGGCAENRFRIIRETMEAVKATCGDDYPLLMKINVTDEGMTDAYYQDLVTVLKSAGELLDAVETSGSHAIVKGAVQKPYFIDIVKKLHNDVDVPLIEVGGFRNVADMLEALRVGASAVSMSRPLLCEPDLPTKIRNGETETSRCRSCGACFSPADRSSIVRCPFAAK